MTQTTFNVGDKVQTIKTIQKLNGSGLTVHQIGTQGTVIKVHNGKLVSVTIELENGKKLTATDKDFEMVIEPAASEPTAEAAQPANNDEVEDMTTVEIQLTKGRVTIIDTEDADLAALKWHAILTDGLFYAVRTVRKKAIRMHRVILARMLNRELLPGEVVDHINGNPLDNRRSNLRVATNAQNQHNRGLNKNSTSGVKGVGWSKRDSKWIARIVVNGKEKYLGGFATAELAHAAYCAAAEKYHGEFANFGISKED